MVHLHFLDVWLRTLHRGERAASLVEYVLLITLIALVCTVAVTTLGGKLSAGFSNAGSSF